MCKHFKKSTPEKRKAAKRVASILNKVEKKMKVPYEMRGMSLAAACVESAFDPTARGDRRIKNNKSVYKAVGVLQLWPFYEKAYGINRKDPGSSASGWLRHIKKMIPKVKKQCKYKSIKKVWIAAWVTGIRYKKKGGRCKEKPLHLKYFKKLRRSHEAHVSKSTTHSGK